jgi:hypothetical protein
MMDGKDVDKEYVLIHGYKWFNVTPGVWILAGDNIVTPKVVIQPSGLFKIYVGKDHEGGSFDTLSEASLAAVDRAISIIRGEADRLNSSKDLSED